MIDLYAMNANEMKSEWKYGISAINQGIIENHMYESNTTNCTFNGSFNIQSKR